MTDDRRRTGSSTARPGDGPIPTYDLYSVLAVRPDATHQEIVEAAAEADRRLRSAAASQKSGATARLKRVNVARHWLLDPNRRRAYDAARAGTAAGAASGGRTAAGKVRAGSATRRGPGRPWWQQPLTWAGVAAVVLVAGFLILRPGGSTGGGTAPSGSAQAQASAAPGASVVASASGAVAGSPVSSGASAGASAPASGGASAGSAGASGVPRASGCPTAQPPAAPAGKTELVTIDTDKGQMQITIQNDLSPIAAGNFVALASCGYYNGVVFHRVATLQDGTPFVIQGGDPTGSGTGGPGYTIQDEPVTTPYKRGTVAMARTSAPNSVGSQFFIVLDDKDQSVLASANTYQIIGSVTSGMETADAIYAAAGGQELPADPVAMTSVTVGTP